MNPKSKKITDIARELLKSQGYFVDNLWHVNDVHFICEQICLPRIRDEEAMEVFMIANDQFDGETGMSWPQLERALKTYIQRRKIFASLCREDEKASES